MQSQRKTGLYTCHNRHKKQNWMDYCVLIFLRRCCFIPFKEGWHLQSDGQILRLNFLARATVTTPFPVKFCTIFDNSPKRIENSWQVSSPFWVFWSHPWQFILAFESLNCTWSSLLNCDYQLALVTLYMYFTWVSLPTVKHHKPSYIVKVKTS